MNYDKYLVEQYQSALREYEIAQNHFEFCSPNFIDSAIDDLTYAEQTLSRILKELRNDMDETVLGNQE